MNLETRITSPATDRAADVRQTRPDTAILVVFGLIERDEFIVSHAAPSRYYKTERAARQAAHRWIAG